MTVSNARSSSPRPALRGRAGGRRHPGVTVVALLNAVAATGGAWGLACGEFSLGERLESRLPWGSPTVGAVALFLAVALPNAVLTVLAWRGDRRTGPAAVVTGVVLVAWIVVELAFIRELSFFHPLYAAIGLLMVWLGRRAIR
jgi:hypothetical protein